MTHVEPNEKDDCRVRDSVADIYRQATFCYQVEVDREFDQSEIDQASTFLESMNLKNVDVCFTEIGPFCHNLNNF